jgi:hypothetical protein
VIADDPTDRRQIDLVQQHLRDDAAAFGRGDFGDPAQIHGAEMPGLATLRARFDRLGVTFSARADGAELSSARELVLTSRPAQQLKPACRCNEKHPADEWHRVTRRPKPGGVMAPVAIRIDTSALTHPRFAIPEMSNPPELDGSSGVSVELEPGVYQFVQIAAAFADFKFTVRPDATIDFDPIHDGFLGGRGSATLQVRGLPIVVDTTALSHALLTDIFSPIQLAPGRHELTLVPAPRYRFLAGSGTNVDLSFDVLGDGTVRIDQRFGGFARAEGNAVIISGYRVVLDTSAHQQPLMPQILGFVPGAVLAPGVHRFVATPATFLLSDGSATTRLRLDTAGVAQLLDAAPGLEVATDATFCGVPDVIIGQLQIQTFGTPLGRWKTGRLRVAIDASAIMGVSVDAAVDEIRKAFTDWQAVVPSFFNFTFVSAGQAADIKVQFDNRDLRGRERQPQGVLADARHPEDGLIKFDSTETWTLLPPSEAPGLAPLRKVALHEIGHALGLIHSPNPRSLMFRMVNDTADIDEDSARVLRFHYGWRDQAQLSDRGTADRPSLATATRVGFGISETHVRMVWRGAGSDERIYQSRLGSSGWSAQEHVPGRATAQGPAIAALGLDDGTPSQGLIMAWRGAGNDQGIYTAVDRGAGWSAQTNVEGVGTSNTPAVADFGGPFLVWKGIGGDQGMWFARFVDGRWTTQAKIPDAGTSAAPALAVIGDRLHLFWKGVEGDQTAYWTFLTAPDAPWDRPRRQLTTPTRATDGSIVQTAIGTTHGPVATSRGNLVSAPSPFGTRPPNALLSWKGSDDRGIWFADFFEDGILSGQTRLPGAGTSTGPAVGTVSGIMHMAWRGVDNDSTIWFSQL